MRRISAMIFLALIMVAVGAYAQNITGSTSGLIADQPGTAVPNATVTATEPAKEVTLGTKTNGEGDFCIARLLPGSYTISVDAPGFKKLLDIGSALGYEF